MFLRISSLCLIAGLVTACGGETELSEGPLVECAIGPGVEMAEVCNLERAANLTDGDAGDLYLIHHPNGGFRRIAFDPRSGLVSAVDGAETLLTSATQSEGFAEFSVGEDRYSLPLRLLHEQAE
jgi:hypothetical protein